MRRRILTGLCILGLSNAAIASGNFDFYVLSLSWSPEFCAVKPENRQCGRGYGLVLHGLWPQYNKGYPESCSTEAMPKALLQSYAGLYPDTGLAMHEWKKHGTCSGLSPEAYVQLSQNVKQKFVTPELMHNLEQPVRVTRVELTAKIVAANPALNNDAVVVDCTGGGRFLQEIHVCYDASAEDAVACSAEMQRRSQKSCAADGFLIRSIR